MNLETGGQRRLGKKSLSQKQHITTLIPTLDHRSRRNYCIFQYELFEYVVWLLQFFSFIFFIIRLLYLFLLWFLYLLLDLCIIFSLFFILTIFFILIMNNSFLLSFFYTIVSTFYQIFFHFFYNNSIFSSSLWICILCHSMLEVYNLLFCFMGGL